MGPHAKREREYLGASEPPLPARGSPAEPTAPGWGPGAAKTMGPHANKKMKIALVHDWLTGMRGGEKVLEVLCERYPHAEIFTLLHVRGSVSPTIERLPIHTSALQRLPGVRRYYRECLPLFPALIEQFDLERFDIVLSSSHCVAKAAIARPGSVHICYCHTPMRYAWDQFDAYFGPARVGAVASALLAPGDGGAGPLGPRHGGARKPLSHELSACCEADPPIL